MHVALCEAFIEGLLLLAHNGIIFAGGSRVGELQRLEDEGGRCRVLVQLELDAGEVGQRGRVFWCQIRSFFVLFFG